MLLDPFSFRHVCAVHVDKVVSPLLPSPDPLSVISSLLAPLPPFLMLSWASFTPLFNTNPLFITEAHPFFLNP